MNKRRFAPIARFGYAARGTVYVIAGVLALLVTIGQTGGQTTGSKGALAALADDSWGSGALVVIAVGLVAFAGWRAVQVMFDVDDHGSGPRGLVIRAGLAVSGLTHLLLGFYAATLLTGMGANSGGDSGSRDAAAWMLQQPYGRYVLAGVALAIAGGAIAQLWKGITGGFRERLDMPDDRMDRLAPLCGFGLVVRGLVFLVIAGLCLYAAFTIDSSHVGGLESALQWLRDRPFGAVFYALAAAGVLAFGLYGYVEAAWRNVR